MMHVDIEYIDAERVAAENAHEVGHDRKDRDQQQASQQSWDHQIVNGVGTHTC